MSDGRITEAPCSTFAANPTLVLRKSAAFLHVQRSTDNRRRCGEFCEPFGYRSTRAVTTLASRVGVYFSAGLRVWNSRRFFLFALTCSRRRLHHKTLQVAPRALPESTSTVLSPASRRSGLPPCAPCSTSRGAVEPVPALMVLRCCLAFREQPAHEMPAFLPAAQGGGAARDCLRAFGVSRQHRPRRLSRCDGQHVFQEVPIGYLAGIVGRLDAGGSAAFRRHHDDLMWSDGSPSLGGGPYLRRCPLPRFWYPPPQSAASLSPIASASADLRIDWPSLARRRILVIAIAANGHRNLKFPAILTSSR